MSGRAAGLRGWPAWRDLWLPLLALAACLALFELTPLDRQVQGLFYDATAGAWLLNRHEPWARLLFYDGVRRVYQFAGLVLLALLIASRWQARLAAVRRPLALVFAAMLLVPLLAGGLKGSTNVACPRDLRDYGGDLPYVPVFAAYPEGQRPAQRQRCFPAGHASGGFALLVLYHLPRRRRRRRWPWLLPGLVAGNLSGGYKMVIGDHFLSHTLVTALLAWILVGLLARLILPPSGAGAITPVAGPDAGWCGRRPVSYAGPDFDPNRANLGRGR